jgi:hypothetical protein
MPTLVVGMLLYMVSIFRYEHVEKGIDARKILC